MRSGYAFMLLAAGVVASGGCGGEGANEQAAVGEAEEVVLGPVDGLDLPPTDLDRVLAGSMAPDFSATALAGHVVTLSRFRGEKNVVLFFYRGHW